MCRLNKKDRIIKEWHFQWVRVQVVYVFSDYIYHGRSISVSMEKLKPIKYM